MFVMKLRDRELMKVVFPIKEREDAIQRWIAEYRKKYTNAPNIDEEEKKILIYALYENYPYRELSDYMADEKKKFFIKFRNNRFDELSKNLAHDRTLQRMIQDTLLEKTKDIDYFGQSYNYTNIYITEVVLIDNTTLSVHIPLTTDGRIHVYPFNIGGLDVLMYIDKIKINYTHIYYDGNPLTDCKSWKKDEEVFWSFEQIASS